jgi:mannose-6-phosphate isomerase-like protein (cupin superfamily)
MKISPRLLALLAFTALLTAQTPPVAAPSAPVAPKPPAPQLTESAVFDWNDMKVDARSNGEHRSTFNNPTETLANFECHISTLNPGEVSSAPHNHLTPAKVEEAILIKDGTLEITINDTKRTVGAGSVIYFAPKDLTALHNVGKTPAVYFVLEAQSLPAAPATK